MDALRFKATRPTYRRGGLTLGSAAWVEVATMDLSKAATIALLTDPNVVIEGQGPGGWERISSEERQDIASFLRDQLTEAGGVDAAGDEAEARAKAEARAQADQSANVSTPSASVATPADEPTGPAVATAPPAPVDEAKPPKSPKGGKESTAKPAAARKAAVSNGK